MPARKRSADEIILDVLLYEDDGLSSARKIKRRLRYHNAGAFRPARVELLRSLVTRLRAEVRHPRRSRYFRPGNAPYATLADFDVKRIVRDLRRAFPTVPAPTLERLVPFAVYLDYVR